MKKLKTIIILLTATLFIAACDNSVQRASNAIGLIQDKVTKIVSDLYEVQNLENKIQLDFETDLTAANNELSYFNQDGIAVLQNVAKRKEHIESIDKSMKELKELVPELVNTSKNTALPGQDFSTIETMIQNLETDLTKYTTDYLKNLDLEFQTFRSIGNPETNFASFFKVFDNINLLSAENLFNLDIVLKHFEPLNSLLVDTKVRVITLLEKK